MKSPAVVVAVGLGGNMGDVTNTVHDALAAIGGLPDTQLLRASRLYRTPAWGHVPQPDFINAVAMLETHLSATELLDALLRIEREYGRDRASSERWGPRTLDLDLLLYGDAVIQAAGLRVPHPHLHQRAFVLLPLVEIAPTIQIPGHGRALDLLAYVDTEGCVALED